MKTPQAHQFYVSFTSAEVKGHKVKMRAVEDVFVSFGLGGPGPDVSRVCLRVASGF